MCWSEFNIEHGIVLLDDHFPPSLNNSILSTLFILRHPSIILPFLSPSVLTSRGNQNTITRPPFDQSPKQQRVTSTPLLHRPQHVSRCHHTQSISTCLPLRVPSTSSSLLLIGVGLLNRRRCECTRPSLLALSKYKRARADSTHSGWRLSYSLSSKAIGIYNLPLPLSLTLDAQTTLL